MLPDRDQQRLNEIERELRSEDPEFARRFHEPRRRRVTGWLTPRRMLGVVAAIAALLCLAVGSGIGFTAAALLAAVLFFFRGWSIRSR